MASRENGPGGYSSTVVSCTVATAAVAHLGLGIQEVGGGLLYKQSSPSH
jgi:hypothetical protein